MAELHRTLAYPHEESIARVVWAAHILSYLTNNRSHEELHDAENNAEHDSGTDEPSDCEGDYETEKTVILSGPRNSVRQKFLDCIAQVLSPCKGWDGVTATAIREGEDGVEVDIARNDGFHADDDGFDCQIVGYCKMLEAYLAGSAKGKCQLPMLVAGFRMFMTGCDGCYRDERNSNFPNRIRAQGDRLLVPPD